MAKSQFKILEKPTVLCAPDAKELKLKNFPPVYPFAWLCFPARVSTMKIKDKVTLEVGGALFTTTKKSLSVFPSSRLAQLDENDDSFDPSTGRFFFDRNPELFNWVLDSYR